MISQITRATRAFLTITMVILLSGVPGFCQEDGTSTEILPDSTKQSAETADKRKNNVLFSISDEVLAGLTKNEQDWYKRFHEGVVFFDGWAEISQEILDIFPQEQFEEKIILIQRLGVKIGTEWCKENNKRKIDNGMLHEWGKKIRAALVLGSGNTTEVLNEIENEVDIILNDENEITLISP